MKYLNQFLKEKYILMLLVPFLTGIIFLIGSYGKGPAHLLVNGWNSPQADVFFKYVTHLGDGAVFALVILLLLFIRIRWAFYELFAALMTLIFVFIAKQIIFKGIPRPTKYFEGTETLHLVEGVKMHALNSFPSGHTITAFAIFITLALIVKKSYLKMMFTATAILAGFSRVYLSQHFLEDVLSGALIGIAIALLSCSLVDKLSIFKTSWIDYNLLEIVSKKHEQ
ncbi:phosphatase PAP2 family protein [Lutimonas sp.]|uniref:phosphatase PAP2 family protein n=1 Tax=Lutimonas sp. TaxID=1872403 RepID=UPI003D9AF11F